MTTEHNEGELLEDEEIERLLASIAQDPGTAFPRRTQLRQRMLDELNVVSFEDRTDSQPLGVDSAGIELQEAEIVTLSEFRGPRRGGTFRGIRLVAAVATLVVGTFAGLAIFDRQGRTTEIDAAAIEQTRFVEQGVTLPTALDAGEQRTDVVGGGIRLQLPPGIEVLEEAPGRLVLGLQGDELELRGRVVVVDSNSDRPLAELVAELEDDGLLAPVEAMAVTVEGLVSDWDLRLTNEAADRFGCESAGPCLPLGPIELWSRGINSVVELTGPDGQTIWWIQQTSYPQYSLPNASREMLGSLRFD